MALGEGNEGYNTALNNTANALGKGNEGYNIALKNHRKCFWLAKRTNITQSQILPLAVPLPEGAESWGRGGEHTGITGGAQGMSPGTARQVLGLPEPTPL